MTFSKASQLSRRKPKSKRPTRDVKAYFDFVAGQGCVVPGCRQDAALHHLGGVLSITTRQALPRRKAHAYAAVVPICEAHHQTGPDSVHGLGEQGFEVAHGLPEHHLTALALSLLAAWVVGP